MAPTAEGCHDANGGTVGGQIGYRWQAGTWVFGVEAQGNWADFNGSNFILASIASNRTKIDAFGLFTGQVGYAANNVLFYVKGGAAVTDNRHEGVVLGIVIDRAEQTRWGATVGAGVEYGFAPNWSFGIEYNHMFMGPRPTTSAASACLLASTPATTDIRRTLISSPPASTTASAARPLRGTDLRVT